MSSALLADWLAWGSLALALAVIAWAAFNYVQIQRATARQRDFENFFRTLERLHNVDRSAILQLAAVYELRNYPRYRELIARICDNSEAFFNGDGIRPEVWQALREEFALTKKAMTI